MRGLADRLHDHVNRALRGVGTGDGQRDALAVIVQSHDHKLAGLLLAGDPGRENTQPLNPGSQELCVKDREQAFHPELWRYVTSSLSGGKEQGGCDVHHDESGWVNASVSRQRPRTSLYEFVYLRFAARAGTNRCDTQQLWLQDVLTGVARCKIRVN